MRASFETTKWHSRINNWNFYWLIMFVKFNVYLHKLVLVFYITTVIIWTNIHKSVVQHRLRNTDIYSSLFWKWFEFKKRIPIIKISKSRINWILVALSHQLYLYLFSPLFNENYLMFIIEYKQTYEYRCSDTITLVTYIREQKLQKKNIWH